MGGIGNERKVRCHKWTVEKLGAGMPALREREFGMVPAPPVPHFSHAAGSTYYFHEYCDGAEAPAEDPKRDQYKSKADIVAFVKKAFADGAAAIQSKGEKGMTTEVVYFPDQKSRVLDIAYGIIEHSGEHYGQLVGYYRLAGLVPPESRPQK